MDLRQLFATDLRRVRHNRRISQEQLAHDAGIDRAYVSRVERATTYVGLEIMQGRGHSFDVELAKFSKRPQSGRRKNDAEGA
jgi:transcriptional regulator with XRE-family HTH domain